MKNDRDLQDLQHKKEALDQIGAMNTDGGADAELGDADGDEHGADDGTGPAGVKLADNGDDAAQDHGDDGDRHGDGLDGGDHDRDDDGADRQDGLDGERLDEVRRDHDRDRNTVYEGDRNDGTAEEGRVSDGDGDHDKAVDGGENDQDAPDLHVLLGGRADNATDLFDINRLRISQKFAAPVEKKIVSIPVGRSNKQEFARIHSGEHMRVAVGLIDVDDEKFLLEPALHDALAAEMKRVELFAGITRGGDLFLLEVSLPGADGKVNEWHRSRLELAQMAMTTWIRFVPNTKVGSYEAIVATGEIPEPVWPDLTLQQMLEIAFRDRLIRDLDHPVLKRLRGES